METSSILTGVLELVLALPTFLDLFGVKFGT